MQTFGIIVPLEKLPDDIAKWTRLEVDTNFNYLLLKVPTSSTRIPSAILIDTGDDGGVMLPSARWRDWKVARPNAPTTLTVYASPGVGPIVAEEGWARELVVGPVSLRNVPVVEANKSLSLTGTSSYIGTFGMAALRQLDFIFDGECHVVYLRTKENPAAKYEHNRLGAVFAPPDHAARVTPGSPAWEAGIRDGDLLLRVGNREVTKWRTEDPWISISEYWTMPAGTKFKLC